MHDPVADQLRWPGNDFSAYEKHLSSCGLPTGDQFGNVKSWKWSFTDDLGRRVTLQLQHNLKDDEESIGNMVKMSMPDMMDDERLCFNERHEKDNTTGKEKSEKTDWEHLIPN